MKDAIHHSGTHLRKRLQALLLLLGLSLMISAVFWLLYQLVLPVLPTSLQSQLEIMQSQNIEKSLRQAKESLSQQSFLPLLFIGVQMLQVIFAPIPGQVMGLAGGWLFGFAQGLSLTMLGLSLGSILAMLLGRYGGRLLIEKMLPEKILVRFDYMIHTAGLFSFFMLFLLPALPDDALCILAGLTRYHLRYLMLVCILGRLPGMAVLTWVGTHLGETDPSMKLILISLGIISFLLWLFQNPIEQLFSHWTQKTTP